MPKRKPTRKPPVSLQGQWKRTEGQPETDQFPDTVTFAEATYLGKRGAHQGFVIWDAGIYRLETDTRLVIGTASDELVAYEFANDGDRFVVTDPSGCRVAYERSTTHP
jgi:hypothetical protein